MVLYNTLCDMYITHLCSQIVLYYRILCCFILIFYWSAMKYFSLIIILLTELFSEPLYVNNYKMLSLEEDTTFSFGVVGIKLLSFIQILNVTTVFIKFVCQFCHIQNKFFNVCHNVVNCPYRLQ